MSGEISCVFLAHILNHCQSNFRLRTLTSNAQLKIPHRFLRDLKFQFTDCSRWQRVKKYFSFSSTLLFEIIWIKEKSERRRMRFISRWGMSEDLFTSSQLNESFENKIKYNFLSRQKALQIQFRETTENFPLGHCVICSFIVNLEIQLFIVFQVPKWM